MNKKELDSRLIIELLKQLSEKTQERIVYTIQGAALVDNSQAAKRSIT